GKVIRRNVNRLNRCNRTSFGRGNPLLHGTHFRSQRRLVSYRRWHPSEQCRYLRTSLGKPEDIVDKEKDVTSTAFLISISEIFSKRQTRKGNTGTCSRRFIHLTENECSLRLLHFFHVNLREIPATFFHRLFKRLSIADNSRFDHLAQQVVSFAGTLANTGKNRKSFVSFCNVVDQFLNQYSFTHTGSTKQTNFTSFGVRLNKVDYFNSGVKNFFTGR